MARCSDMRRSGVGLVVLLAALGVASGSARAQDTGPLAFDVTVVLVSPSAGEMDRDPRARRIHELLGPQIRYESLRVLSSQRQRLALDEVGSVALPTGARFRFRPLDLGKGGVLVSVDMDRTAQGDFRIPRGKPLVLGGQPYQDGKLVVLLEVGY
jgi:hypothetical protein